MEIVLWILSSILVVSLVSLIGIFTLLRQGWFRQSLALLVSFSAGALFGDAFLHLLPEAFEKSQSVVWQVSVPTIIGIVFFLVLEKIIHWHHCHGKEESCEHEKTFGWMNLMGDGVHNIVDGMVIAGSFLVAIPLGITTTLAVFFHEIPQEISDFGVLLHAGFSQKKALVFNFLSALGAFAGAVLVMALNNSIPGLQLLLLGFTAGGFIYIAGTDLIPELHKETRFGSALLQVVFILLGIVFMLALLSLE